MKYLLIASRPRSGTHFLRMLLASCPGVASIGYEPFHPDHSGGEYWDHETDPATWIRQQSPENCSLGVICNHPTYTESDHRILPALQSLVTHVVCLYRRDMLAQYVSWELARTADSWCTEIGYPPTAGTVFVRRFEFWRWAEWIRSTLETTHRRWGDYPMRTLAYEDLAADWRGTVDRLGEWLDIDTSAAQPQTAKHELRPLSEVVENYDEAIQWAAQLAIP